MRWINLQQEEQRRRDDELKRLRQEVVDLNKAKATFLTWVSWFARGYPDFRSRPDVPQELVLFWDNLLAENLRKVEEDWKKAEAEKAARVKQLKTELAGMEKRRAVVEKELGELCPA